MTGLTPVFRVAFQSWTAPAMEPWSVRLTDGISSSAARETRSGTRHAPSRIEYSEWTWRWTNSAWAIADAHSTPGSGRVSKGALEQQHHRAIQRGDPRFKARGIPLKPRRGCFDVAAKLSFRCPVLGSNQ